MVGLVDGVVAVVRVIAFDGGLVLFGRACGEDDEGVAARDNINLDINFLMVFEKMRLIAKVYCNLKL